MQRCNNSSRCVFVNRMPMWISRSDKIKFVTVSFMENRTKRTRFGLLKTVANMCARNGFKVRFRKSDGEFEDLVEPFVAPKLDVEMNITAIDEHVGEIERSIRVAKERTWATCDKLPHKKKPKTIVRAIIKHVKKWLNSFSVKDRFSKTLSPRKTITVKDAKFNRERQLEIGSYAQAHESPDPSNRPEDFRSIGAIALGPS